MKPILIFIPAFLLLHFISQSQSNPVFDRYFLDKTMRIDFYQTGNAEECFFSIDQVYEYEGWAGHPAKLIDDMNSGMYYLHVVDPASNTLIYSRGFATLFGEYSTTAPAMDGLMRSFHQTALIPYPKFPVLLVILGRDQDNLLVPLFRYRIDPKDINIIREAKVTSDRVIPLQQKGHPHNKVDIVFIAEGYRLAELDKFKTDCERFTGVLFGIEPFRTEQDKFNVTAVFRASDESGADEPDKGIFRNTVVSAAYNALDLDRYLLIDDTKTLNDIASAVPHEVIIVIANINRYGGGGIFNDYTIFTADDSRSAGIFIHEFGHGFANLADEYYSSTVSYNEFFPAGREPHEPNITRLPDPDNVKWKHLLTPGIEVPTYWGQNETDSLNQLINDLKEQKARLLLQQNESQPGGSLNEQISVIDKRSSDLTVEKQRIQKYYADKYKNAVGVFEGAGYSARGIYRSGITIGFNDEKAFNPVSSEAILKVIRHLSE
jgi:hypothetical protein